MSELPARLGQIRLRDLLLLQQIEQRGSLRSVAEGLNISQPAVTQALQGLESAFGVALVERGRRGVQLTAAGRAALTHVRAVGQEVLSARSAACAPDHPHLQLGCTPMSALAVVPNALARFQQRLPQARISLHELPVPALWSRLQQGELDVIVSRLPASSEHGSQLAGLQQENAGEERMVLVAARSHPLARRVADLPTLAGHAWALPPAGSLAAQVFREWFTRARLPVPEVRIISNSFVTNLRLAASCGLLTLAPQTAVLAEAAALKLKIIETPWEPGRGEVVVAWRASRSEDPMLVAFRESIRAVPANEA